VAGSGRTETTHATGSKDHWHYLRSPYADAMACDAYYTPDARLDKRGWGLNGCRGDHMDHEPLIMIFGKTAHASCGEQPMARRRIACKRCGREFDCSPSGNGECWCTKETYRVPMPVAPKAGGAESCLCPSCLRLTASALTAVKVK
jgi:hypothetical protein